MDTTATNEAARQDVSGIRPLLLGKGWTHGHRLIICDGRPMRLKFIFLKSGPTLAGEILS